MKRKGLYALFSLGLVLFFFSCSKLNEPTELGGELIPAVDNVNTFDTTLPVLASYHAFNDSTRNLLTDNMALGQITDPVFGTTKADMFFNLSSPTTTGSPFVSKDAVVGIDSVVLSLAYMGSYGDTSRASRIDVSVSEINQGAAFNDTTLYRFDKPPIPTGTVYGTTSFSVPTLRDSITLIRKTDTTKVANVLRIRLNNSLGTKLSQYDTTAGSGAYANDSLFRSIFRGLAVTTNSAGNPGTLAYFNPSDAKSGLTVYFRVNRSGVIDTTSQTFTHKVYSQVNSVIRTPGGEYLTGLDATSPNKLYIQSAPTGSYASIRIPALTGFPNKIIHRAELIVYKVPSTAEDVFTAPGLLLDHRGVEDTTYLFDRDIAQDANGNLNLIGFGGALRTDNSYRFTLTRYVQGIVTRAEPNDTLRLYAPLRSVLYSKLNRAYITLPILRNIAYGRAVLAGPNYSDPSLRMRLRVVYSNL